MSLGEHPLRTVELLIHTAVADPNRIPDLEQEYRAIIVPFLALCKESPETARLRYYFGVDVQRHIDERKSAGLCAEDAAVLFYIFAELVAGW
jgi:hypothetical protein